MTISHPNFFFLFQRHHGITISQPNEFEQQYRPSIIAHLPPLSAREVRI